MAIKYCQCNYDGTKWTGCISFNCNNCPIPGTKPAFPGTYFFPCLEQGVAHEKKICIFIPEGWTICLCTHKVKRKKGKPRKGLAG